MNLGLSEKLNILFPTVTPVPRPVICDQDIPHPS